MHPRQLRLISVWSTCLVWSVFTSLHLARFVSGRRQPTTACQGLGETAGMLCDTCHGATHWLVRASTEQVGCARQGYYMIATANVAALGCYLAGWKTWEGSSSCLAKRVGEACHLGYCCRLRSRLPSSHPFGLAAGLAFTTYCMLACITSVRACIDD